MAISSISDIIIAITLCINGVALISSNPAKPLTFRDNHEETAGLESDFLIPADATKNGVQTQGHSSHQSIDGNGEEIYTLVVQRVRVLLNTVRKFSFLIALWNFVFVFLIIFVFNKKD